RDLCSFPTRRASDLDQIRASVLEKKSLKVPGVFETHALDAMDVAATKALVQQTGASIVINVGSPFINMPVLTACIETGASYIDTAVHEDPLDVMDSPPWYANNEWKRRQECEMAGVTDVRGAGVDPGVVNADAGRARERMSNPRDSSD